MSHMPPAMMDTNTQVRARTWPKVAVVILNWNGYEHTRECLRSLEQISYANHEVIVVDNGSTDGSAERLQDGFPWCRFVRNRRNLGFAAGCNTGIRYALRRKAEHVLLLNNDAVLTRDALEPAVQAMERDSSIGLIGGKIYYKNRPRVFWYAGGTVNLLLGRAVVRGEGESDRGQYDEACEVGFVTGAMMLISRRVLETVGMLEEAYFFSTEEYDYSLSVRRAGYKLLYVPEFVSHHATWGSHKGLADPKIWYCVFRCRLIFQSRFHSKAYLRLWTLVFAAYYLTLAPLRHLHRGRAALRGCRVALKAAIRDHRRASRLGVTEADLRRFEREFYGRPQADAGRTSTQADTCICR